MIDLHRLEKSVREIEKITIGLDGDINKLYKPYPLLHPSLGSMKEKEWVIEFNKIYPDLEVELSAMNLTLSELRQRHEP